MSERLVEIGSPGLDWLSHAWSDGLSTARLVAQILATADARFFALAGDATLERLLQFDHGGLPRANVFTCLANELSRRFNRSWLFVELPMVLLSDPGMADAGFETVTCGDEVYAIVSLAADAALIEQVLRENDPSGIYNAFVLNGPADSFSGCPREQLEIGKLAVCAALTGAYDGEGFVIAITEQCHAQQ